MRKIVEDMTEILNTDIRNNTAEIKNTIKEMRNLYDGMNNGTEESVSDLEE